MFFNLEKVYLFCFLNLNIFTGVVVKEEYLKNRWSSSFL